VEDVLVVIPVALLATHSGARSHDSVKGIRIGEEPPLDVRFRAGRHDHVRELFTWHP